MTAGRYIVCVRERHESNGAVLNDVVSVPVDGSREPAVLARCQRWRCVIALSTVVRTFIVVYVPRFCVVYRSYHDFFAYPIVSPDGTKLACIAWDHPRMPWDGTLACVIYIRNPHVSLMCVQLLLDACLLRYDRYSLV
jgi:hypothetical protein